MVSENVDNPSGVVLLNAFDGSRKIIFELELSVDDYYDESHPLIDDNAYRGERGIRYVHGRIYDYDGKLDQEFNNEYGLDGVYIRSRIVHGDGTIIED